MTARSASERALWTALLLGGAVAIAVGVYGSVHDPAGQQTISLFFSNTLSFKAWTTTLILFFAFGQVYSALRMWGKVKIPRTMPSWWGDLHRLSGTIAFALSLPVAFHCLWALGFEPDFTELRRFAHSVLGCLFYGAFAAKVTLVRSHDTPSWSLPVVGGVVFTTLVAIWLTTSLWFFTTVAFPGDLMFERFVNGFQVLVAYRHGGHRGAAAHRLADGRRASRNRVSSPAPNCSLPTAPDVTAPEARGASGLRWPAGWPGSARSRKWWPSSRLESQGACPDSRPVSARRRSKPLSTTSGSTWPAADLLAQTRCGRTLGVNTSTRGGAVW